MEKKKIDKFIESLDAIELNDAILAVCRAYELTNQENELVVVALPKYNQKLREQGIEDFCRMIRKSGYI